ncbi:hypothetical protein EV715DRAFT_191460 [Schizophyllum commune]
MGQDKYHRNARIGDTYARSSEHTALDRDRAELFAGYNPSKSPSHQFEDGGDMGTEEDIESIKQQTRQLKQEDIGSTRNALRTALEAEQVARDTLGKIGDQSERLANSERYLDMSRTKAGAADDKVDELKKLNRSIFRPVITFHKDAKRAAQEAKVQQRYEEEREGRAQAMMEVRGTRNRLEEAGAAGSRFGNGKERTPTELANRKEQRQSYQFEATESDEEIEDELDDNLDEIGSVAERLKALGSAMGEEIDEQTGRVQRIGDKSASLDTGIFHSTQRMKRFAK